MNNDKNIMYYGDNYVDLIDIPFKFLKKMKYANSENIIEIISEKNNYTLYVPIILLNNKMPIFEAKINTDKTNTFNLDLLQIECIDIEIILQFIIYGSSRGLYCDFDIYQFEHILNVMDKLNVQITANELTLIRGRFIRDYMNKFHKFESSPNKIATTISTEFIEYVIYFTNINDYDNLLTDAIFVLKLRDKSPRKYRRHLSKIIGESLIYWSIFKFVKIIVEDYKYYEIVIEKLSPNNGLISFLLEKYNLDKSRNTLNNNKRECCLIL